MAVVKRGSVVKKGLKFFIYGEHGTWKSTFALNMAKLKSEDGRPLRVLYIDCETGSIDNYLEDLQEEGIDLNNILIVYTTSYSEVEEWANKAINNEDLYIENEDGDLQLVLDADGNPFRADVIVVDGITVISDNVKFAAINVSEKRARLKAKSQEKSAIEQFVAESTAGLEFKDHDKIKMKGKNLLRRLITGTDKYVVVTAREKTKKVMQKNGDKMELIEIGKVPDTWEGAEYEFYTVLRHFEDEDGSIKAQVMRKDRTKVFAQNEIIDNPTPLYWQCVIDSNRGKNSVVLNDSIEKSVIKDEEVITKKIEENNGVQNAEESELTSVEDYRAKIESIIKSLTPHKKKALRPKVERAGINPDYNKIDDIEELKRFLEIIAE